jgi:hypothetical protein
VYFGWHYIVDDFAGLFIGLVAVWGAERMTTRLSAATEPSRELIPGQLPA